MTEQDYVKKLLEQLDALDDLYADFTEAVGARYRRFTWKVAAALVILTASNAWFLFVALPGKTDQIQDSRAQAARLLCEDEKLLVSIVPEGYPPLREALRRHPDSALNPARDCDQFVRAFVGPR